MTTMPMTHPTSAKSPCGCPPCRGLECFERPRFFAGQLLTEADLNSEQAYLLAKNRLHNRYLHGWGVACGLEVVCHDCDGWVRVKPGYALDPCGNDIVVCGERELDVTAAIQKCLDATRRGTGACPPWQDPNAKCTDEEEHWCITIAYQETEARPTTPLRRETSAKSCGCGGGCGDAPAAPKSTARGAACEPTRTFEQYRLDVVPQPKECAAAHAAPVVGRLAQPQGAGNALFGLGDPASFVLSAFLPDSLRRNPWTSRLLASAPDSSLIGEVLGTISAVSQFLSDRLTPTERTTLAALFDATVAAEQPPASQTGGGTSSTTARTFSSGGSWDPQSLYDLCCRFRAVLQDLYNENPLNVRCGGFDCGVCVQETTVTLPGTTSTDVFGWMFLNLGNARQPASTNNNSSPSAPVFACLIRALIDYVVDAVCLKLIPPCPPTPCDNRLILACVTRRKGKIVHICNFACRQYAGSFNSLAYWASAAPFTSILVSAIRTICCAPQTLSAILGFRGGETLPPAVNP